MKAKKCGPKVQTKQPTSTYKQDTVDMMPKTSSKVKMTHRGMGRKR